MGLNHASIGGNRKYHQGLYTPNNPDKYVGDPNNIIYRSSLEKKFCFYCDNNDQIIKWGCETIIITYNDFEGKVHKYYPDFYMEVIYPNSLKLDKFIIEVKPYSETLMPTYPNSPTLSRMRNFEYQLKMYRKNIFKWSKAVEWCKNRDMTFKIITEKNL